MTNRIISTIGKMIVVVICIITTIMIWALGASLAYCALRCTSLIPNLPDIPYDSWMALSTMITLVIRFWPFKKSSTIESQMDLFTLEGFASVSGIYVTNFLYIISGILSLIIASLF